VAANKLKKQKEQAIAAKQAAAAAKLAARKAAAPTRVSGASAGKETPSKAFERLLAPFFIPPAIAKQRPELVEEYQSSTKAPKRTTGGGPWAKKIGVAPVRSSAEAANAAKAAKVAKEQEAAARAAKAARDNNPAVLAMEEQRRKFDAEVAANKLQREREREAENRRYAGQVQGRVVSSTPQNRARSPPKTAPAKPTAAKAGAAPGGETPAKAFERVFAPIFIPPAVAAKRPDLVQTYQNSPRDKSPGVSKPRAAKSAPKVVATPRVTKSAATAPPKKAAGTEKKGGESLSQAFERVAGAVWVPPSRPDLKAKVSPSSPTPRGVVQPARVTKRAPTTAKGRVTPTRGAKKPATTAAKKGESPSAIFGSIFGGRKDKVGK
jgi:hypothetical protein